MSNDFSGSLISWYRQKGRDLPWRHTSDPYVIWISEVMLQQTQVSQSYDYFIRFTKRFPDVRSLAEHAGQTDSGNRKGNAGGQGCRTA